MIRKLPPHLIHQIAAGEVIERPSSALKELIENSLDAKASKIRIEYENGGLERLLVEDNGEGIAEADFPLVFEAHATSKISELSDFDRLSSFGFRGEALAALGQVAEVDVFSATREAALGSQLSVRFGAQHPLTSCDKRIGTLIVIRRIFAQHPVRLRFLKSGRSEAQALHQVLRKYALAYPEVAFEFGEAAKAPLKLNSSDKQDRTLWYFESEEPTDWMSVKGEEGAWRVDGFALKPSAMGQTRAQIILRLNRRPIQDRQLEFAVRRAFEGYTEFPKSISVSLDIEGDPQNFDVNVHPTKAEVRFRDVESLFSLIVRSIRRELEQVHRPTLIIQSAGMGAVAHEEAHHLRQAPVSADQFAASPRPLEMFAPQAQTRPLVFPSEVPPLYEYLGHIDNTYLVARAQEDLYLFDQHALHERIIYERLLADFQKGGAIASQRLLFPQTISLEGAELLLDNDEVLRRCGFEVRAWSGNSLAIVAAPSLLKRNYQEVLSKILECVELPLETLMRETLATIACHSAVRAHDHLSDSEVRQLFRDFQSQDSLGHCPHGRPTFVRMATKDLEKMFHRVL